MKKEQTLYQLYVDLCNNQPEVLFHKLEPAIQNQLIDDGKGNRIEILIEANVEVKCYQVKCKEDLGRLFSKNTRKIYSIFTIETNEFDWKGLVESSPGGVTELYYNENDWKLQQSIILNVPLEIKEAFHKTKLKDSLFHYFNLLVDNLIDNNDVIQKQKILVLRGVFE